MAPGDTLVVTNEVVLGSSCDNLSGRVYVDDNGNCTYDQVQDIPLPGRSVWLKLNGQVVLYSITDQDGEYSFNAVTGLNYDVEIESMPLNFVCPTGGSHTVSSLPASNLDFGLDCPGSQYDLESQYAGGFLVPGVARNIYFNTGNNLCTPVSGTTKLVLNSNVQYVPSSAAYNTTPDKIVGDTLFFNFNQLIINGKLNIRIQLKGDTSLTVNDSVCLTIITTPTGGDADASNNVINPCLEVRTSYDPNMKSVSPAGEGAEGDIHPDQEMLYTIHFQNTGNFMATNIFILDTIDTQSLDLNTLKIVDYSHPMELKLLKNNILRFNFNSIMLPDSNSNEPLSHGYVSFTIDQVPALADGSIIENTAGIYFDYNPPISYQYGPEYDRAQY
ncbi:MAG: carboxypeptidase-like regulatory domain-containing protein [Owenweeksia sp.]|nr:carboxypeptidase-like regulatory domain-containing protein [Owenweeksia sp.]